MSKKDKLTINEIIEIGEKIKFHKNNFLKLNTVISNGIGKSKKASNTCDKISNYFDSLSHELEVEFWSRLDKELENPVSCFYGYNKPIIKGEL